MDTCNNITFRKSRMRRSLSCFSNESDDSSASNLSVKSMIDLSTHLKNDESLLLKNTIEHLKEKLCSVQLEIEALGQENASLKQQLAEEKLKTEHFRKTYITSRNASSTSSSRNIGISEKYCPNKNKISARKLDLDLDFHTPKPTSSSAVTNEFSDRNETKATNMKYSGRTNHNVVAEENTQDLTSDNKQKYETRISNKPKTSNILILSDNQGKGIVEGLLKKENKFIMKKYVISGIRKPGAKTEEVLLDCDKLTKNFSKNDSVIIMTGSNDSNPVKFIAEMSAAIKILKNCNIFIVSVKYNAFLNECKLNCQLKLLAQNYKNCNFIEANSYNSIIKQLIHKINVVQYYDKYLLFNENKGLKEKPGSSEIVLKTPEIVSDPVINHSIIKTLESATQPKKGTIPYYFRKITPLTKNYKTAKNIVVSEEPFFRTQ
ncbi:hypothetical protein PYW08_001094 [Mythimna loreyi]|uniref:Uncharacterized protein n=1 Tax=Mythimna loreyi TaxID=667449 RepID=A0ACC2QZN6_9NEOP|nr:hypothetical protein PYW08_001094 [Mythimna loreyi]